LSGFGCGSGVARVGAAMMSTGPAIRKPYECNGVYDSGQAVCLGEL